MNLENFDFRKQDDQTKFDQLPQKNKDELVGKSYIEAHYEHSDRIGGQLVPVERLIPEIKPQSENIETVNSDSPGAIMDSQGYDNNFLLERFKIQSHKNLLKKADGNPVGQGENIGKILYERLKGQIVVDLGCSHHITGVELAESVEARGYVGVDKDEGALRTGMSYANDISGLQEWRDKLKKEDELEHAPVPVSIVIEDMLSFLKRLPDRSVSVLLSQVDGSVMYNAPADYRNELKNEIIRVLHPKGLFYSSEESFLGSFSTEDGTIIRQHISEGSSGGSIYYFKDK